MQRAPRERHGPCLILVIMTNEVMEQSGKEQSVTTPIPVPVAALKVRMTLPEPRPSEKEPVIDDLDPYNLPFTD